MILLLMPQNIYEKRVRQRNRKNRSNGYTISDEFKKRAHFNIFITNVPEEVCNAKEITNLYKLRWQIELIFKTWKSIIKIDKLKKC